MIWPNLMAWIDVFVGDVLKDCTESLITIFHHPPSKGEYVWNFFQTFLSKSKGTSLTKTKSPKWMLHVQKWNVTFWTITRSYATSDLQSLLTFKNEMKMKFVEYPIFLCLLDV